MRLPKQIKNTNARKLVHAHLKVVIIFFPEEKQGSSSVELTYFTVAIFTTPEANTYKESLLVQAKSILQPWS